MNKTSTLRGILLDTYRISTLTSAGFLLRFAIGKERVECPQSDYIPQSRVPQSRSHKLIKVQKEKKTK